MKASSSIQPRRRSGGRGAARPALAAFLPAVVLAILFMAGCSQSSGTQQASEEQRKNEELQQRVDQMEKEKEEEEVQQQIDELKKEQEEQADKQEEQADKQEEQGQEPQVVVERNEVVGTAAPEGRVVITPDATYAGTAQEAAALDAAIAYYEAAELGNYAYTYDALVGPDQSRYSYGEWQYANEQLDTASGEFVIFSVEEVYATNVRVGLTVYPASGSAFNRYTDFVYENGAWRHSLTREEYDLFDSTL